MKRVLSIILALSMIFALCACGNKQGIGTALEKVATAGSEAAQNAPTTEQPAAPEETAAPAEPEKETGTERGDVYTFPVRTPVPFNEMTSMFDAEATEAALADVDLYLEQDGALDKLLAAYDVLVDQYDALVTDGDLAYLRYCMNVYDEELFNAYSDMNEQTMEYGDLVAVAIANLINSEKYGEEIRAYINSEDVVRDFGAYTAMTDEEFELSMESTDLQNEYNNLDFSSDDIAEKAGDLYLRVLDNLIAQAELDDDYDDYAEKVYDYGFFRDYAPEDTAVLYQWGKEHLVDWYILLNNALVDNYDGYLEFYALDLDQEEIIDRIRPYVTSVSDKAAEAFDIMVEYGLYDIGASDTKYDGGYTTDLLSYGIPFIFNCPYGYGADVETMIHEFGHYYEAYVNDQPQVYLYDCIDLAEIDSQGLEMLMMEYTDEIFGEDMAEAVRLYNLYSMVSAIINGCVFDEFQQKALYGRMDGTLTTPEQLDELFYEIEYSYYGDYIDYFAWSTNGGWYQVPHTYMQPFYYISYATSATAALGIRIASEEDYDQAVKMYNELVEMGNDKGFSHTLNALGLPNPLTEEGCAELTAGLEEYLGELTSEDAAA